MVANRLIGAKYFSGSFSLRYSKPFWAVQGDIKGVTKFFDFNKSRCYPAWICHMWKDNIHGFIEVSVRMAPKTSKLHVGAPFWIGWGNGHICVMQDLYVKKIRAPWPRSFLHANKLGWALPYSRFTIIFMQGFPRNFPDESWEIFHLKDLEVVFHWRLSAFQEIFNLGVCKNHHNYNLRMIWSVVAEIFHFKK